MLRSHQRICFLGDYETRRRRRWTSVISRRSEFYAYPGLQARGRTRIRSPGMCTLPSESPSGTALVQASCIPRRLWTPFFSTSRVSRGYVPPLRQLSLRESPVHVYVGERAILSVSKLRGSVLGEALNTVASSCRLLYPRFLRLSSTLIPLSLFLSR